MLSRGGVSEHAPILNGRERRGTHMADEKKTGKAGAGASTEITAENFDVASSGSGASTGIIGTKVEGMYSASKSVNGKGEHARIYGWLMGVQQIETKYKEDGNGEKMCLAVDTLKPTLAVSQGKPYVLPADARLLVPIGGALANAGIEEKATNEEYVFLVEMYPTHQTETNKGFNFWHWQIVFHDVKKRSDLAGASVEGTIKALEAKKTAALPAKSTSAS